MLDRLHVAYIACSGIIMRIMGLDVGTKNIGVAISDETGTIAQSVGVIKRTKDAVREISSMAGKDDVGTIVVGHPINMDGSQGERAQDAETFAGLVEQESGIQTLLWDERLSTKEAEDVMIEADISRKKRKKSIDKLAAQIILQNYLDSK